MIRVLFYFSCWVSDNFTFFYLSIAQVLRVTIKSTGCFDPPYHGQNCDETVGSITVNGVEMSLNKPGFNFVTIDFKTGKMEDQVNFDTHGESGASDQMANYLSSLKLWKIICVAVKQDGADYLTEEAIHAFVSLFLD